MDAKTIELIDLASAMKAVNDEFASFCSKIDSKTEAKLTVLSLGFEPGSRWSFYYNGQRVAMNVKNDALAKAIDEGARFGKGDVLRVKLRIIQEYVPDAGMYRDSSFKIVEFYEQIRAERQGNLF